MSISRFHHWCLDETKKRLYYAYTYLLDHGVAKPHPAQVAYVAIHDFRTTFQDYPARANTPEFAAVMVAYQHTILVAPPPRAPYDIIVWVFACLHAQTPLDVQVARPATPKRQAAARKSQVTTRSMAKKE